MSARPSPEPICLQRILIANRGEIARRIISTASEMGIRCVAVYTDADRDAPFVADADEAVRLENGYLDGPAILEAARETGAQAIHPGYGFLSENADFARAVQSAGLRWIGPSPEAIARMGDKLEAKKLAESQHVPILRGSEEPADAESIGYPILVKAAAGGGGKGMRVVESPSGLEDAIEAAKREALSGFGDARVFLERYVPRARHIEIQILGDTFGTIVHLGERECSIQRRHQKIIEESPSPRIDEPLREQMGEAALRLARALDYESAGTVEFLLDDDTGDFFFLEVNTRLQVEHPVTEEVTGIDLVRAQLRIAEGHPLDFDQEEIFFDGAAIEARLYAENPENDFLPETGRLDAFEIPDSPLVRFDTGVVQGTLVGTDFDPMLAKVIAYGPNRREAAGRLALALERLHLGGVITNRDFLVSTLRSAEFLAGETTTDFIERVAPPRSRVANEDDLARAAKAAALWIQGRNRAHASVWQSAPSGWRNARMPEQRLRLVLCSARRLPASKDETEAIEIRYRRQRDGTFRFADGAEARILAWSETSIDLEMDGRRQRLRVTEAESRLILQTPRGDLEFEVLPRFEIPGSDGPEGGLVAPMPGKVIEVRVAVGDRIRAGQTVVLLEAMKMEHPMRALEDGIVREALVSAGDQIEKGTLLLIVESGLGEESD